MTLQTVSTKFYYPFPAIASGTPGVTSASVVDNTGEYYSIIFQAEDDMVVSHVGAKFNAATGSPTAEIRIETVDASNGQPSGTLWATDTSVTTATLTTTWAVHALTAAATIPRGSWVALTILYASGTSFALSLGSSLQPNMNTAPYSCFYNGSTVTKTAIHSAVSIALGSNSTTFYNTEWSRPISTAAFNNFSNSVAGAMRGARFQLVYPTRVIGLLHQTASNSGDFDIGILSDAGSELSNSITAIDGNYQQAAGSASSGKFYFDNPVSLAASTWYRAIIRPTSATNVNISTMTAVSADVRSTMPGGLTWHYATFTTAGGWDDTNTTIYPILSLILDQLPDDVGSGGGVTARVIGS